MLKGLLILTCAAEFVLVGYVVGKYDLDDRARAALKRKATEAIAYAKAVEPAKPARLAVF